METLFYLYDCSWKYGEKRVDTELSENVKDAIMNYCDEDVIKSYLLHVKEVEVIRQGNFDVILNIEFSHDIDMNDVYEWISLSTEILKVIFNKKVRYFYFSRPRDLKHMERLAIIRSKYKEKIV